MRRVRFSAHTGRGPGGLRYHTHPSPRSALEHVIGDGLLHADAGDPGDDVVQALDVLHVDRGMHGNARLEELLDVLPALGMPRPRLALERVAVRELVDEQDLRLAREGRVEVEVAQRGAPVSDLP